MKKFRNLYLATIPRIFHIFCTYWSICRAFITHSRSVNKPSKFAVGSSSTVINNRKLPIYPQQISSINLSSCHTDRHSWSALSSFLVLKLTIISSFSAEAYLYISNWTNRLTIAKFSWKIILFCSHKYNFIFMLFKF